ncbi:hypothetical protein PMIN03_010154 [Paraphaeosphaeria minitans]
MSSDLRLARSTPALAQARSAPETRTVPRPPHPQTPPNPTKPYICPDRCCNLPSPALLARMPRATLSSHELKFPAPARTLGTLADVKRILDALWEVIAAPV